MQFLLFKQEYVCYIDDGKPFVLNIEANETSKKRFNQVTLRLDKTNKATSYLNISLKQ